MIDGDEPMFDGDEHTAKSDKLVSYKHNKLFLILPPHRVIKLESAGDWKALPPSKSNQYVGERVQHPKS